jgi:hypothetical protein
MNIIGHSICTIENRQKLKQMKLTFFRTIAAINKAILPSYKHKDLTRLSKFDKAIVGWRYWITKNALGN